MKSARMFERARRARLHLVSKWIIWTLYSIAKTHATATPRQRHIPPNVSNHVKRQSIENKIMTEIIKISFVLILVYLIILLFPIIKAGLNYDIEKKKVSNNYSGDHSGLKSYPRGHFRIPWPIDDPDPRLHRYVNEYNRLSKVFWCSYLIGIPLLILLGTTINKL